MTDVQMDIEEKTGSAEDLEHSKMNSNSHLENSELNSENSKTENAPKAAPALENSELDSKPEAEPESSDYVPYSADNAELDEVLGEATATQEQKREQQRQQEQAQKQPATMGNDEAMHWAIMGVQKLTTFATEQTGVDMSLPANLQAIVAIVFAPCVQKYGATVKEKLSGMGDEMDLNSNTPEYMAAGGAAALGGYMWWQYRKAQKGAKHGH